MQDSRRGFLKLACAAGAALATRGVGAQVESAAAPPGTRLREFGYGDVNFAECIQKTQFIDTQEVLMNLSEDSLLKPFRLRAGLQAPGDDLGGWYDEDPRYNPKHGVDHGFAPASTFGQWVSALARGYAATGSASTREKVRRLLEEYSKAIDAKFYTHFRFPSYTYDKLVLALIDARQFCAEENAFAILDRTTNAALPHLPERAFDRGAEMCAHPHESSDPTDESFCWDESYTLKTCFLPTNAVQAGGIASSQRVF